ncbi:3-oxo-Delta(4,5)-steroid 5-beta-reductase-like [Quillaja saponaria]|uniref:3-oxo-Delta(4,5)-steroid 5-beta-reductase-like n=1 Tax=Quillaja saponaria TaxID=32244 RepID=A0AAD7QF83_QUISA|nr:3-oxo-Delta(4,5)-steroid 5-beta-reductase-like [Quillaja saponaria]
MELQTSPNFVALIVGITGMAGLSIAEALKRPDSLAGPWKVYGAARRPKPSWHQGLRFRYPGTRFTWEHFCDMTDARVLADQHVWAAVTAKAKNEAFNCTNGEVFMWKNIWKLLCGLFDVEYEPFDESQKFDFVGVMKGKGEVWDEIVEKYGLHKTKLEEITCFAAVKTVLDFDFQHVSSMTKSREYGFFGYANTFKSIRMWVEKLRDMKIIP